MPVAHQPPRRSFLLRPAGTRCWPPSRFGGIQPALAQAPRAYATLAMVAEPQTLDPMASTADLVGTIMQHVYEPLYTFDANWNVVPMLAESAAQGLRRRQVLQHHAAQGREAAQRPRAERRRRGRQPASAGWTSRRAARRVAKEVDEHQGQGPARRRDHAEEPVCAAGCATGAALRHGRDHGQGVDRPPLKEFVGTGPYKFKERKPDQYVLLTRFDGYSARKEPASGYGGKREALLDELRFVPVPNANTRVEGSLAGQYHYADLLPVEALGRLEKSGGKTVPILTPSFGFPYLVLNTKEGVAGATGRCARRCRPPSATARCWRPASATRASSSPRATTSRRARRSTRPPAPTTTTSAMPPRPRPLAEKAGYKGEPIRILTSRQYDFHYNMALVMAEQLKRAGFKAELNVVDWATLVQRRNDSEAVGHLHHALRPVPRADAVAAATRRRRARAGGARRPSRPRWPRSTARPIRPSAARCGARCSRSCTTRCPTSTSASSTACRRRAPALDGYVPCDLAVLLEHRHQVAAC